jgi:hypothetical protein
MKSALAAAVSPSRRPRPRIGAIAKYWNTIPKAPMAPRPGLRAPATAPAPRAPGPSRHRPGPNYDDGASWWSGQRRWSIAVVTVPGPEPECGPEAPPAPPDPRSRHSLQMSRTKPGCHGKAGKLGCRGKPGCHGKAGTGRRGARSLPRSPSPPCVFPSPPARYMNVHAAGSPLRRVGWRFARLGQEERRV